MQRQKSSFTQLHQPKAVYKAVQYLKKVELQPTVKRSFTAVYKRM